MVFRIDTLPPSSWEVLADTALTPLQQRWQYGAVARSIGNNVHRHVLVDGDRPIALALGICRRLILPVTLISRGPIWIEGTPRSLRVNTLATLRRSLRGAVIVTAPDGTGGSDLAAAGFRQVMTPSTIATLTLGDDLRRGMHGKWRNRLNRAERSGLTVRSESDIRWLIAADLLQQRKRRYRNLPPAFTEAWHRRDPTSTLYLSAWQVEDHLAAMLFLRHGATATYHIGWTSDAGRRVGVHHLLLAQAADRLGAEGVRYLDLGTIDTVNAPGLARFKLGTGAVPQVTGGTWLGW